MENNKKEKTIKEIVLSKIESGKAKMKPRWHFILKTSLIVSGVIILVLALLYLSSFIVFVLRQTGVLFAPAFGLRGIGAFLFSIPWLLVVATLVFLVLLAILVRQYSFTYRKPLVYSLMGLVVLVIVGTFIIPRFGVHQFIYKQVREANLPFAGPFYRGYGMQEFVDIHAGVVKELTEDGFVLTGRNDNELKIIVSEETRFPRGINFAEGDEVVVIGEEEGGVIEAFGIRGIDDRVRRSSRRPGWFYPTTSSYKR